MLKVLDFTMRLPGPRDTYYLMQDGCVVTKIEDTNRPDPFNSDESKLEPLFKEWYQNINAQKNVLYFNFNDQDDINKIHELIATSDIVILTANKIWQKKLGIENKYCGRAQVFIELAASSGQWQSLHDINVFGMLEISKLHLTDCHAPPFLPLAAIQFSQKIARTALSQYHQAFIKNKLLWCSLNLLDSAAESFAPLTPTDGTHFLHNGKFPCYQFYKTKDGEYFALAAVEEKFWNKFCEIFQLNCSAHDRFNTDGRVQKLIENAFCALTSLEVSGMIAPHEICLTRIGSA